VELTFLKHFEKIKENVDDIRLLSKGRLTPLVNQVSFHLNCLENDLIIEKTPEIYLGIEKFVENGLKNLSKQFLNSSPDLKELHYSRSVTHLPVYQWERVLEIFPNILKFSLLLQAKEGLYLDIGSKFVTLKLKTLKSDIAKIDRVQIYAIYRKLFQSHVLATFVCDENHEDTVQMTLLFDISHRDDVLYQIDLDAQNEKFILMTNILDNYVLPKDFVFSPHTQDFVFELSDSFALEKVENFTVSPSQEVLSFSFLFRHIYLIIPLRGTLIGSALRKDVISTHTIDFFSFLSN